MATVDTLPGPSQFVANPTLLKAIIQAVDAGLSMCDMQVRCVGVSTIPTRETGAVTGLIGVHGNVSGFITVNMAEKLALTAVAGLLQEPVASLTNQVVDGVGEITNMVSGGLKKGLAGTTWAFSHVTVPSVIVGQNYQIAFTKGLEFLAATFEHVGGESVMLSDRLMQVAVSLICL